jgi:hypothetical protein
MSSTLSRRARSGSSLWTLTPPLPEAHVGVLLPLPLMSHLVFQDGEDKDVAALPVVEVGVAEHSLLLEAIAGERVDARRIVGKHLGLDAMEAQRIHRVGNQEPRRLHAPASSTGGTRRHRRLEKGDGRGQADPVEPHEPDGLTRGGQRFHERGQR